PREVIRAAHVSAAGMLPSTGYAPALGFVESVEQPSGILAGQGLEAMPLTLLERESRDRPPRGEVIRFPLHLVVPAVLVVLADIEEHANVRELLQLLFRRLPQVAGKGGRRQKVLRVLRRDMHRGDSAIRRTGDVELPAGDLVLCEELIEELGEDAVAALEEQLVEIGRAHV